MPDYQALRPAFLSLSREDRLALVLSIRSSRLTIKEKVKRRVTGKKSTKQNKLLALLQELSDEDKQLLIEELNKE
jgi:hypothetical protein